MGIVSARTGERKRNETEIFDWKIDNFGMSSSDVIFEKYRFDWMDYWLKQSWWTGELKNWRTEEPEN